MPLNSCGWATCRVTGAHLFNLAAVTLGSNRFSCLQQNRCLCRFDIILRHVSADSSEAVSAAAAALKQSGFINYFGLQRFGTGAVPTHRSVQGCALLNSFSSRALVPLRIC
jgi:hypothetical protein